MYQKAYAIGGVLLLILVTAFVTPASAQRAGHGGGHFGGGHFGGGHFRGSHFGVHRGGFFHGGVRHFGHPHTFFRHHSRPFFYGYYPYYSGYYPAYPYSTGNSGYSDYYGGVTPYYDDYSDATPPAGNYQSLYPSATATPEADTTAQLTVTLPADARLWLQGVQTTSTGPVRQFVSPPLTPGKRYTYEAKASWTEEGDEVTQTQRVPVTAGARVDVHFPVPPTTTEKASNPNER